MGSALWGILDGAEPIHMAVLPRQCLVLLMMGPEVMTQRSQVPAHRFSQATAGFQRRKRISDLISSKMIVCKHIFNVYAYTIVFSSQWM